MRSAHGFRFGWLDLSVGSLVADHPDELTRFAFVLIACIDSDPNVRTIAAFYGIAKQFSACATLGDSLVVRGVDLPQVADRFNGFDEAWFFDAPPLIEKPNGASLVYPLTRDGTGNFDEAELSAETAAWMTASHCRLGLGDGCGLNYVTPDECTAQRLESAAG